MSDTSFKKAKMTKTKSAKRHPIYDVIVRRVVRISNDFICGICRTHHHNVQAANSCLVDCWDHVRSREPYRRVRRVGRYEFACIYCLRSYLTPLLAVNCAEDCLSHMHITGFSGEDLSANRPRRTWTRPGKPTVVLPFARLAPETHDKDDDAAAKAAAEALEAANKSKESEDAQSRAAKAAAASAEEDAAKDKEPKDRTKKFSREGAKYVCEQCKMKYFSKEEVVRCFDSHAGGSMDKHGSSGL